jgi:hypothetical protein
MSHIHDHNETVLRSLLRGDPRFADLTGPDQRIEGGRWRRPRLAAADHLAEPVADNDHWRARIAGVRAYQRELARRSQAVLRPNRVQDGWCLGPAPYGYRRRHQNIDAGTGHPIAGYRLAIDRPRPNRAADLRLDPARRPQHPPDRRPAGCRPAPPPPPQRPGQRPALAVDPRPDPPHPDQPHLPRLLDLGTHPSPPAPPQSAWVWSAQPAHPALITSKVFWVRPRPTAPRPPRHRPPGPPVPWRGRRPSRRIRVSLPSEQVELVRPGGAGPADPFGASAAPI